MQDDTGAAVLSNNLTTNPNFLSINQNASDYLKLSSNSTDAVDQGADLSSEGVTTDYFGTSRPQGTAYDIGAHEYVSSTNQPPTVTLNANPFSGDVSLAVDFTATASDSDGKIVKYEWDFDGNGVYDLDTGTTPTTQYTYQTTGTYNAKVRVTDDDGAIGIDSVSITVNPPSLTGDVNGDGSVNTQDVQACINHILGRQDWGGAADINGDGSVDVLDVQSIINVILGR